MENDKSMIHGKCLCGAVSISFQQDKPSISACHCGICRNWAGGPFLSLESHKAPVIQGEEHVRSYASSEWAERSFCDVCGTHLFYRLKAGGFHAISAGLFKDSGSWPFELQVFIDDKPDNYQFANKTREMTGEEVVKLFS
ncbi:GFA family protein [Alcaligenes sp. SORT26]|uniref:GFA family protein n=1 Tax=Alcaligenes sp. SORT26 TaxID=2813780 RepID=UPI001A9D27D7|nr:GFA family protein [Alcaligenes sp. SORT26]QTC00540.1 GFA family protein [Alcaligenes sp. SORT26]